MNIDTIIGFIGGAFVGSLLTIVVLALVTTNTKRGG